MIGNAIGVRVEKKGEIIAFFFFSSFFFVETLRETLLLGEGDVESTMSLFTRGGG